MCSFLMQNRLTMAYACNVYDFMFKQLYSWFGHVQRRYIVGLDMSRDVMQTTSPQSDGAGTTRYQTTRAPQEDMAPTNQGRHDVRRCYPGCGPRPEGVEEKDKADP